MNTHAVLLSWFDESICTWLEQAPFGLILVDDNARVVWANSLQSAFTESSPQQVIDLPFREIARMRAYHLDQAVNLVLKSGLEWHQRKLPEAEGSSSRSLHISILPIQRQAKVRGVVVLFEHPRQSADFNPAHRFLLERLSSTRGREGGEADSAEASYIAFQRKKQSEPAEKNEHSDFSHLLEAGGKIWPVSRLVAAKQEAQQRLVEKLCHDVRNVITPLWEWIRQLDPMAPDPEREGVMERIDGQKKKFMDLLLGAEKLIKDYPPDLKPVPWFELLHAAYDQADLHRKASRPQPRFDLQQTMPHFFGNSTGLFEAFSAILLNALEAVDEQGEVTVTLRYEKELDRYLVVVADNGIGIPAEIMANIFDAYYTTEPKRRAGLGLAIAYRVIQSHQGMIQIKSVLNRGTEVRVTLPAKHDALPRAEKSPSMQSKNRPNDRKRR